MHEFRPSVASRPNPLSMNTSCGDSLWGGRRDKTWKWELRGGFWYLIMGHLGAVGMLGIVYSNCSTFLGFVSQPLCTVRVVARMKWYTQQGDTSQPCNSTHVYLVAIFICAITPQSLDMCNEYQRGKHGQLYIPLCAHFS